MSQINFNQRICEICHKKLQISDRNTCFTCHVETRMRCPAIRAAFYAECEQDVPGPERFPPRIMQFNSQVNRLSIHDNPFGAYTILNEPESFGDISWPFNRNNSWPFYRNKNDHEKIDDNENVDLCPEQSQFYTEMQEVD